LEIKLPPQGINVDLKVWMIPTKAKGKISRNEQRRFHVVDLCVVEISDDVEVTVRESNHAMLVNVFSGVVKRRIKEAMEKTLTGQFRALIELDRLAYDVGERRKVCEVTSEVTKICNPSLQVQREIPVSIPVGQDSRHPHLPLSHKVAHPDMSFTAIPIGFQQLSHF
jgi:hypothetical protein